MEDDLAAAFDAVRLRSGAPDVFRTEALPAGHPFRSDPRILVTPHTASDIARDEVLRQLAATRAALAEGRVPPGAGPFCRKIRTLAGQDGDDPA